MTSPMEAAANVARMSAEIEAARIVRVETRLDNMQRDFGKMESTVDRIEAAVQQVQLTLVAIKPPRVWPTIVAYAGMLIPMYALVADLIARGFK